MLIEATTERFARRATPDVAGTGFGTAATLPSRFLNAGARRLGNFALLAAFLVVSAGLLEQLVVLPPAQRYDTTCLLAKAGAVLISLGMFVGSRVPGVPAAAFLERGLEYEVFCALLLSIDYHGVAGAPVVPRGFSPIALWIVIFPLIVPSSRGRTRLATVLAALMDPLGLAANALRGHTMPGPFDLAQMLLPTAFAAVAGIAGARIVYRLSSEAGRAREMGSYRLVRLLGRGGMGEVWRAEHRMLARPAAIKLIHPHADDPSARDVLARFEREARATASLRSPHTIQVYDYGATEDGRFYYVMELLEGLGLEEVVRRSGPQPEERVVHILRQVCHSLEEAHRSGLSTAT